MREHGPHLAARKQPSRAGSHETRADHGHDTILEETTQTQPHKDRLSGEPAACTGEWVLHAGHEGHLAVHTGIAYSAHGAHAVDSGTANEFIHPAVAIRKHIGLGLANLSPRIMC